MEDVVSIATGQGLSIALKSDGTVSVLGGKHFKLAEYARQLKDFKSVAAGFFVGGAVKKDGTLMIWGREVDRFSNPDMEQLVLFEGSE